jgi:hypothetical protein
MLLFFVICLLALPFAPWTAQTKAIIALVIVIVSAIILFTGFGDTGGIHIGHWSS